MSPPRPRGAAHQSDTPSTAQHSPARQVGQVPSPLPGSRQQPEARKGLGWIPLWHKPLQIIPFLKPCFSTSPPSRSWPACPDVYSSRAGAMPGVSQRQGEAEPSRELLPAPLHTRTAAKGRLEAKSQIFASKFCREKAQNVSQKGTAVSHRGTPGCPKSPGRVGGMWCVYPVPWARTGPGAAADRGQRERGASRAAAGQGCAGPHSPPFLLKKDSGGRGMSWITS